MKLFTLALKWLSLFLVAKSEFFEDNSADARKGKRLLDHQLAALQGLRGHLEKCRQKKDRTASEKKIQTLWTGAKIGSLKCL